jgi:Flp pilus assembly protein TadD
MFLKLGYTDRGGEDLRRAYQLDNTDFMVLLNYGNYQLLTENYKRSVELLTRAVEVRPNDFSAHLGLATAYFYFGDTTRARASLAVAELLKKTLRDQQKIGHLKQLLEETE